VMNGQVGAALSAATDFLALHRSGKLRILATSGAQRWSQTPDVPTFRELGHPAFVLTGWHGVFAPGGTPPAVVERLSMEIGALLDTPDMRDRIVAFGLQPAPSTPRALASRVGADIERWRDILKASSVAPE
jgi:tripartite-type tricarboxylate transporter receptor subunit TctC